RYRNRFLQLESGRGRVPARGTVQIGEARDGTLTLRYRDRVVAWHEIAPGSPIVATPAAPPVTTTVRGVAPSRRTPGADHPWRQHRYTRMRGRRGAGIPHLKGG